MSRPKPEDWKPARGYAQPPAQATFPIGQVGSDTGSNILAVTEDPVSPDQWVDPLDDVEAT